MPLFPFMLPWFRLVPPGNFGWEPAIVGVRVSVFGLKSGTLSVIPCQEGAVNKPVIALTMGDPCGIGPEIIAKALADPAVTDICRPVVIGDQPTMVRAIAATGLDLTIEPVEGEIPPTVRPGVCPLRRVTDLPGKDRIFGNPTPAAGDAMFLYLDEAVRMTLFGDADAIVTAPINKDAMNRGGHHYHGHTEALADLTNTSDVVMMLAGPRLKVSLVTIHEPLARVPSLITHHRVLRTIQITHDDCHRYFVRNPRIAVAALNPHAGEGGMFGAEEARIIVPAIEESKQAGIDVSGPFSADTLFNRAIDGEFDAVVCMYHDQGLIPLKLLHFDDGVNITLGLPIIRTSVDHGTAYDLAGTGKASASSLVAAIQVAVEMALVRRRPEE